jgi:DNA-binding beta-propeller fold protein YncE
VNRHRRLATLALAAALVLSMPLASARAPQPPGELKVLKTIEVGPKSGFDYPLVDAANHRLYLSHATNVIVFDLDKEKQVGTIDNVPGSHGIAVVPDANLGFATAGKDNAVVVFDLKTLKPMARIKTGKNPDAICFDPATKKVFAVCHGDGTLSVIDPAKLDAAPETVMVGGVLETAVADGAGKVFVNVEDKAECVVVDSKALKVLARWKLGEANTPTGLALDASKKHLYVGCRSKHLVVLDAEAGKILATLPIGAGNDGVIFDPAIGAVSADGKDATASVVRETKPGVFEVVQTLKTFPGAKTITVDLTTHRIYLPANVQIGGGTNFAVVVVGVEKKN